jgi:predicted glycosyltransferase
MKTVFHKILIYGNTNFVLIKEYINTIHRIIQRSLRLGNMIEQKKISKLKSHGQKSHFLLIKNTKIINKV